MAALRDIYLYTHIYIHTYTQIDKYTHKKSENTKYIFTKSQVAMQKNIRFFPKMIKYSLTNPYSALVKSN